MKPQILSGCPTLNGKGIKLVTTHNTITIQTNKDNDFDINVNYNRLQYNKPKWWIPLLSSFAQMLSFLLSFPLILVCFATITILINTPTANTTTSMTTFSATMIIIYLISLLISLVLLIIMIFKSNKILRLHSIEHKVINAYNNGLPANEETIRNTTYFSTSCGSIIVLYFVIFSRVIDYLIPALWNPFLPLWLTFEAVHWTQVLPIGQIIRFPQRLVCWSPNQKQIEMGVRLLEQLYILQIATELTDAVLSPYHGKYPLTPR